MTRNGTRIMLWWGIIAFVFSGMTLFGKPNWQDEADQRIEKIRKGTLRIQVVDKKGNPVEGVQIKVNQTRHAFRFGTAVATHRLTEPGAENDQYREMLKKYFTMASPENDLKWGPWDGEFDPSRFAPRYDPEIFADDFDSTRFTPRYKPENFTREKTIAGLQWLKANGFYVRGHTLVWPSWRRTPNFLNRFKNDTTGLRSIIRDHILEITYAVRHYVDEWDAVNEPVLHIDLIKLYGPAIMSDWFKFARSILPNTPLYLNETNLIAGHAPLDSCRAVLERYLQILMANDTPLNGLGIQGHVRWAQRIAMPEVLAYLDHVWELGLPVAMTEFDMRDGTEREMADYTRDFYIALFSHPAVRAIQMWGFWEGDIQRPKYASFRTDWTPRPNGQAYIDLVFKKWWTNAQGVPDKNGLFKTRAFYGDYEITVQGKDKHIVKKVNLPEGAEYKNVVVEF